MKFIKVMTVLSLSMALVMTGCSSKKEEPAAAAPAPSTETATQKTTPDAPTSPAKADSLEDILKKAMHLKTYSYELVTVTKMGTFTTQFYQDGERMKNVTKMPQGETVSIVTKDKTINYDPATKMGMSYTLEEKDLGKIEDEQNKSIIDSEDKYVIVGEETVNGYPCVIIEPAKKGADEGKVWVSKEYGIMIKMMSKDAESGEQLEMNCKNIKIGSLPADTFKVPSDIKIVEAGKYPVDGE